MLAAECRRTPGQVLRVRAEQAERLEKSIDHYNERLQPLKSFILPGGTAAAAWCHPGAHRVPARRTRRGDAGRMARRSIRR